MKTGLDILVFLLATTIISSCKPVVQTALPTYTSLPTYTPYPTYTTIPTSTSTPTFIPSATHTPTITPTPTETGTPTSTPTKTPTPTETLTPTRTPRPTNTLPPTRTPIPAVSLSMIYYNFEHMTDYQFTTYKSEIVGKPVRETATIASVDSHGRVGIHGEWMDSIFNLYDFCVVVTGVPSNIAISLDGGDNVHLEATINRFVGNWDFYNNCEVTLVLYYVKITK